MVRVDLETMSNVRSWIEERIPYLTREINSWRQRLSEIYGEPVKPVTDEAVRQQVADLFSNRGIAINLTALVALALALSCAEEFDELMVDDMLGAAIAELIAGNEPHRMIARSNFHLIDIHTRGQIEQFSDDMAAVDDLIAGLVAGLESRLPGWRWME